MQQSDSRFQSASEQEIAYASASILRAMDLGVMAVDTSEKNGKITCIYRVGEQSQFIRPRRYVNYLPVMIRMEWDCHARIQDILERIGQFYASEGADVVHELQDYTQKLYASGQRLNDWNINLMNWAQWNRSADDAPAGEQKRVRTMFNQASEQLSALMRYEELYS